MIKKVKEIFRRFFKSTEYPTINRIYRNHYGINADIAEVTITNLTQMSNFLNILNMYIERNQISSLDIRRVYFELGKMDAFFSKNNHDILTKYDILTQDDIPPQDDDIPPQDDDIPMNKKETMCIICLEDNSDVKTKCGHSYHQKCIDEWCKKSPTCPMCRTVL